MQKNSSSTIEYARDDAVAADRLKLVIPYTTPELTRAALGVAATLAGRLSASVVLVAVRLAPLFPLFRPSALSERLLMRDLAVLSGESTIPVDLRVVMARNRLRALERVLTPNSLVLLAERKHPWRKVEARLASRLERAGHNVVLLEMGSRYRSSRQACPIPHSPK